MFNCPYAGPQEKPGMSGQKIGKSKEVNWTFIPFQPRSVSGWTRTEGMQPLEKETRQRRKMREALMRLILETACLLLACTLVYYWHVWCRPDIYPALHSWFSNSCQNLCHPSDLYSSLWLKWKKTCCVFAKNEARQVKQLTFLNHCWNFLWRWLRRLPDEARASSEFYPIISWLTILSEPHIALEKYWSTLVSMEKTVFILHIWCFFWRGWLWLYIDMAQPNNTATVQKSEFWGDSEKEFWLEKSTRWNLQGGGNWSGCVWGRAGWQIVLEAGAHRL